jgi:hypothetical protein
LAFEREKGLGLLQTKRGGEEGVVAQGWMKVQWQMGAVESEIVVER